MIPPELFEIELHSGREREAVKNPDVAAKLADGWEVMYCWISTQRTMENGVQKGPDRQYLMVVMRPPGVATPMVVPAPVVNLPPSLPVQLLLGLVAALQVGQILATLFRP